MIEIRLQYATLAEAAASLAWLERRRDVSGATVTALPGLAVIGNDAPDVGQVPGALAPQVFAQPGELPPQAVFGGAVVPVPPALSTAVAAASPTAPAVPTATSPTPPLASAPAAPTPAPVAPAPTASAAPTSHAGREVDASGLWWDERIHSSTKSKTTDGMWRQKRGINDPALVKRIEGEIRAAMAAPAVPPVVAAAPVQPVPAVAAPVPPAAAPAVPPVVAAAPVQPVPAVAAPVPPAATLDFGTLMMKIQPLLLNGQLPQETLNAALKTVGLGGIGELMQRPDLVLNVHGALLQMGVPVI